MENKEGVNKTPVILAVVALILAGSAFMSRGNSQTEDSLARVLRKKQLSVCVAEWPPFSIKDAATGEYSGVDIDAINAAAQALDVKVVYQDTTFGNTPAALQSGTCDVSTSLYVTPSRAAAVNFTDPVLYGGNTALVKKGDTRFQTLADLDKEGITIATATGESGDIYAKANFTKATVRAIDIDSSDQSRFMLEVTSGRADVAIADYNTIGNFAKEHPETEVIFQEEPFNLSPDAYGVRYGDDSLLSFLNNTLLTLKVNGTWDATMQKYDAQAFEEQLTIK